MNTLVKQTASLIDHYNELLGSMTDLTKARQVQDLIDRLLELQRLTVNATLAEGTAAYQEVLGAMDEANASAAWTRNNLSNFALGLEKANEAATALDRLLEEATGLIA